MAVLRYNGRDYQLENGDIPGINGNGTIVVESRKGFQHQSVEGDVGEISMAQRDGRSYINGVDIKKLTRKLDRKGGTSDGLLNKVAGWLRWKQ